MKKVIIGAAVFALALVALRRFGPALGKRAMSKCQEMFERRQKESPPEETVRDVDAEPGLAAAPG